MNGDQIRAGRERRGWTQGQLAQHVGVGSRTVGNWERGETVPQNRMTLLEDLLGPVNGISDPLREASELALLNELMRRASLRQDRERNFG